MGCAPSALFVSVPAVRAGSQAFGFGVLAPGEEPGLTLVGTAVGDALGAPMEGQLSTGGYVATLDTDPGDLMFTDDTAMTIGVAVSLLGCGGFEGHHMAHTFARSYAAEPWRGYGASPPEVFGRIDRGVPWDEAARSLFGGEGSFGNGAAMRVAPVALFAHPDTRAVAGIARDTAVITHTHPEGVDGAVAQAVAVDRVLGLGPDEPLDPLELIDGIRSRVTTAIFRDKLAYLYSSVGQRSLPELAQVLGSGVACLGSHRPGVLSLPPPVISGGGQGGDLPGW